MKTGARRPISVKRVYDTPAPGDGLRVLVDALWPRGLRRDEAAADLWLKEAAPSSGLRKWFGHDARRWREFRDRYRGELAERQQLLHLLDDLRQRAPLTLLFGAADTTHNNAVVLRELLEERAAAARTSGKQGETP
jgi:uncharacterized protein YeaO (DUF488 family)